MKKIFFFVLMSVSCFVAAMQTPKARIVPMYYSEYDEYYFVLLVRDKTPEAFWTDFFQNITSGSNAQTEALVALSNATNQLYDSTNLAMSNAIQYQTQKGDIVYFAPVKLLRNEPTLNKVPNKEFVWIPVNHIIGTSGRITPPNKSNNISDGVLAMLRTYLPITLQKLKTPTISQTSTISTPLASSSFAAPQPGAIFNSWLNIPGAIYFYEKGKQDYKFTNFWGTPEDHNFKLFIDGKHWPTTEHYFQAQKFPSDPTKQEEIRLKSTPGDVFRAVRGAQVPPNWHTQGKFDAMLKALRAKFSQNAGLQELLLNTQDAIIVEASPRDAEWGYGNTDPSTINQFAPRVEWGEGKNHLGQMLMHVREELITGQQKPYIGYENAQKYFQAQAMLAPTSATAVAAAPTQSQPLQQALINLKISLMDLYLALLEG